MHESTLDVRHARDGRPGLVALLLSSTPRFDPTVFYELKRYTSLH